MHSAKARSTGILVLLKSVKKPEETGFEPATPQRATAFKAASSPPGPPPVHDSFSYSLLLASRSNCHGARPWRCAKAQHLLKSLPPLHPWFFK